MIRRTLATYQKFNVLDALAYEIKAEINYCFRYLRHVLAHLIWLADSIPLAECGVFSDADHLLYVVVARQTPP
jgi:hypothetical protein